MHFKHFFLTESNITNKFIHMSKDPVEELKDAKIQNHHKPKGLWAGIGSNWIKWVEEHRPKWIGDYFYTFNIKEIQEYDKNQHLYSDRVIRIKPEMVSEFNFEFSMYNTKHSGSGMPEAHAKNNYKKLIDSGRIELGKVNWERVSQICGGVLFSPYDKTHFNANDPEAQWYYDIDIPSVCIFKKGSIKNWKQIPSKLFLGSSPR